MRRLLIPLVPLALIAIVLLGRGMSTARQSAATAGATPDAGIPGLQSFAVPSRAHVLGSVIYPQDPPIGGPHNPIYQDCGFYAAPVGNEHAVHSLEHGAVWITYRPDLPPDQIAILRHLAAANDHVLVSPYPGLPAPVVASAWGKQLRLPDAADPRLARFVAAFADAGPEGGGACAGGTTDTIPWATPQASPVASPAASPVATPVASPAATPGP